MYTRKSYGLEDPVEIRRLIRENAFATLVLTDDNGPAATHLPCLLDPRNDGTGLDDLVLVTHTARADPLSARLQDEPPVLLIFHGPHGYISPSWYEKLPNVGTWNFSVVHVHGRPELLEGEEAFEVLELTQRYFEQAMAEPFDLDSVMDYARKIAPGTVPFRLRATRVEAKTKMSQDKPDEVQQRVIEALESAGPYRHPELAAAMRKARERRT